MVIDRYTYDWNNKGLLQIMTILQATTLEYSFRLIVECDFLNLVLNIGGVFFTFHFSLSFDTLKPNFVRSIPDCPYTESISIKLMFNTDSICSCNCNLYSTQPLNKHGFHNKANDLFFFLIIFYLTNWFDKNHFSNQTGAMQFFLAGEYFSLMLM